MVWRPFWPPLQTFKLVLAQDSYSSDKVSRQFSMLYLSIKCDTVLSKYLPLDFPVKSLFTKTFMCMCCIESSSEPWLPRNTSSVLRTKLHVQPAQLLKMTVLCNQPIRLCIETHPYTSNAIKPSILNCLITHLPSDR